MFQNTVPSLFLGAQTGGSFPSPTADCPTSWQMLVPGPDGGCSAVEAWKEQGMLQLGPGRGAWGLELWGAQGRAGARQCQELGCTPREQEPNTGGGRWGWALQGITPCSPGSSLAHPLPPFPLSPTKTPSTLPQPSTSLCSITSLLGLQQR